MPDLFFIPCKFEIKAGNIIGYANTPVADRGDRNYKDLIPADLWLRALQEFFVSGAEINFLHRPIAAGKTVSVRVTTDGPLLETVPIKQWVADAIASGDIAGYSIEYKLHDFEMLPSTDMMDQRPTRKFKDFSLVRVSYVDQPMNQGSYFTGGTAVNLKDYEISFNREKGLVTIVAKSDQAMADISAFLSDGIKNSTLHPDVAAAIGVKVEDFETVKYEIKAKAGFADMLGKFKDEILAALSGKKTETPDDAKAMLEQMLEQFKSVGLEADALAKLEGKVNDLIDALPAEGEKSFADRMAELESKTAGTDDIHSRVGNLEDGMKAILKHLEGKVAAPSAIVPGGEPDDANEEKFWSKS